MHGSYAGVLQTSHLGAERPDQFVCLSKGQMQAWKNLCWLDLFLMFPSLLDCVTVQFGVSLSSFRLKEFVSMIYW